MRVQAAFRGPRSRSSPELEVRLRAKHGTTGAAAVRKIGPRLARRSALARGWVVFQFC